MLPGTPLTSNDFLVAMIWGEESSITSFTFNSIEVSEPINSKIEVQIDLTIAPIVLPALNQYAYFIDIGLLPAAEYNLIVNHTGDLNQRMNTNFSVVPLPSAVWLLFSGIVFLLRRNC